MATLKQLVDETTNIKNELKTCHTNLKSNLIEKGENISDDEKLLSLINKVKDLSKIEVTAGDETPFCNLGSAYGTVSTEYKNIRTFTIPTDGSFRIKSYTCFNGSFTSTSNGNVYMKYEIQTNGLTVWESGEISNFAGTQATPKYLTADSIYVKKGSILMIKTKAIGNSNMPTGLVNKSLSVTGNIKW